MYERRFGTDWKSIDDREEVVWRAYALGVAERLGEDHPEELDRLVAETETSYDRQFAKLAYRTGRARSDRVRSQVDDDERVWRKLVPEVSDVQPGGGLALEELIEADPWLDHEGEPPELADPVADRPYLPNLLGRVAIDSRPDDSRERVERPTFVDRESPGRRIDAESLFERLLERRDRPTTDAAEDDA